MKLEEIKKDLIAFKGNRFIYARSCNESNEPFFYTKILSIKEMELIDKNPALLNDWD